MKTMVEADGLTSVGATSRINEAGNAVTRIGMLWHDANMVAAEGDLKRWNAKLERVWSELSGDCQDTEDADGNVVENPQKKQFNQINAELKELKINYPFNNVPPGKRPNFLTKLRDLQYEKLMEKDEFLRVLQNKQGKGTLYRDEFEDDFE